MEVVSTGLLVLFHLEPLILQHKMMQIKTSLIITIIESF